MIDAVKANHVLSRRSCRIVMAWLVHQDDIGNFIQIKSWATTLVA